MYNLGLPDGEVNSRDEFEAYMAEIRAGSPDVHLSFEEVAGNDDIVMAEFRITGTHESEFQGLPPTGREAEIWGIDKLRIDDGTITEYYTYYDTQDLANQLGLSSQRSLDNSRNSLGGRSDRASDQRATVNSLETAGNFSRESAESPPDIP